jgi:hypothetical protein
MGISDLRQAITAQDEMSEQWDIHQLMLPLQLGEGKSRGPHGFSLCTDNYRGALPIFPPSGTNPLILGADDHFGMK